MVGNYKNTILANTVYLYSQFFEQNCDNARILIVGVEDGNALCKCADLIIRKNIKLFCINVESKLFDKCKKNIEKNGLEKYIVISKKTECLDNESEFFDSAYIINCYTKLEDREEITSLVLDWLKEGKVFYISTVLEDINKKNVKKLKNYKIENAVNSKESKTNINLTACGTVSHNKSACGTASHHKSACGTVSHNKFYRTCISKLLKINTGKKITYEDISSDLLSIGAIIESFEYEYTFKKYGAEIYSVYTLVVTNHKNIE
jgi:hypothetical protein